MTRWFSRWLLTIALLGLASLPVNGADQAKPKYIFLLIGDGMGMSQRAVAERYLQGRQTPDATLQMNRLPVRGQTETSPANGGVTDSAAAGTALACGEKTSNGTIGMTRDRKTPLRSIATEAKGRGLRVGILTSVPIDHATPAVFYAHQPKRDMYYEIAGELGGSGFDFFAGEPFLGTGKAKGRRAPDALATEAGYRLLSGREGLTAQYGKDQKILWQTLVRTRMDQEPNAVQLAELVARGIAHLDNEAGFFMMAEGGRIDWACHGNDLAGCIYETVAFDEAVAVAVAFGEKHPAETLIVVTADHETGGLGLDPARAPAAKEFTSLVDGRRAAIEAVKKLLADWKAQKPTAEEGLAAVAGALGITAPTAEESRELLLVVKHALGVEGAPSPKEIVNLYGKKDPVTAACQMVLDRRCGVSWKGNDHTAAEVTTTAWGAGSESFSGQYGNQEIGMRLRALILAPAP